MIPIPEKITTRRLEALVDGVFAIVMTLLVLDIKVPSDINIYRKIELEHFITGHFQDIILFVVDFLILGYLWIGHHTQMHFINKLDRKHLWINITMLLFISMVPFTSALVNKFAADTLAEAFLAVNMLCIGLCNLWNWSYAVAAGHLTEPAPSAGRIRMMRERILVLPAAAMAALACSFIFPVMAFYLLLSAPAMVFAMNEFEERKNGKREAAK